MSGRISVCSWRGWLVVACFGMLAGACGPEPPGGGADGGSVDANRYDADASNFICEVEVDGECRCNYQGTEEGVCGEAFADPSNGACREPEGYESPESSCADEVDNDCDGDVDCADPVCADEACGLGQGTAKCVGGECRERVCHDGADNDEDGATDCLDADCEDRTCSDGTDRTCPAPEDWEDEESTCDDLDNDCDGAVDEGCPCTFDANEPDKIDTDGTHDYGVCTSQSRDDQGRCERPQGYQSRTDDESACDGEDNDCDGTTDEGCGCTYDPTEPDDLDTDGDHKSGACVNQSKGNDGRCQKPSEFEQMTDTEANCDTRDNDCDGAIDEGCNCQYDPTEADDVDTDGSHAYGVCQRQTQDANGECSKPGGFEKTPGDDESGASCIDGTDNDCDGTADDGCACDYDPADPRNVDADGDNGTGVCTRESISSNTSNCTKPTAYDGTDDESSAGLCDGKDNDCDGAVDEGCSCTYDPTETDSIDTDGSHSQGVCTGQTRDSAGACRAPSTFEQTQADAESGSSCIDGKDNDCDGASDEGCTCTYDPSDSRNIDSDGDNNTGVCTGQTVNNSGTSCKKPGDFDGTDDESSAGLCDGKDNDCDGAVDEGCSCTYDPTETNDVDTDGTHGSGVCPGQTRDGGGVCQKPSDFEKTQGDDESGSSCSDGKDNDCDGGTDEGCPCDYNGTSTGVCSNGERDSSGNCTVAPPNYESPPESSCDVLDNDCDGDTDEWDEVTCTSYRLIGGADYDTVNDVAVDSSGPVYLAGHTLGDIAGQTHNGGSTDAFVAKFDAIGRLQWVELFGTSDSEEAEGIAVDGSGYVYVSGQSGGDLAGETNSGNDDGFLAKYDASGTRQWLELFGTSEYEFAYDVATDDSGSPHVVGETFGDLWGHTTSGSSDGYLAQFDSSGTRQWETFHSTSDSDETISVASDESGNLYAVGRTGAGLGGGSYNGGIYDAFVAKHDASNGSRAWTELLGTSDQDAAQGVAADGSGRVYVGGRTGAGLAGQTYQGGRLDAFAAKYDGSGNRDWVRLLGTGNEDEATAAAVDASGNGYIAGDVEGAVGGQSYGGSGDAFLSEYDPSGNRTQVDLLGTSSSDHGNAAAPGGGGIFVGGVTRGDLGGWTNSGSYDGFVALVQ